MTDLAGSMENIAKLGLTIKEAAGAARLNEEDCREVRKRVLRFNAVLSQLQQTEMVSGIPAMSGALEDLR
ncbi:hypothetical protein C2845_PM02G06960 [Panicum miliaceum]|uniref:Uncharacterized protein n=1 Tax=Panicum miliaceum TaxID=4540 RepID=A0A3L6SBC5_PANMI|nr:hypothetical protein C2845_PM02G06960 [Panicum miliaceum]